MKEYQLYIDYPGRMDSFIEAGTALPRTKIDTPPEPGTSHYGYADGMADHYRAIYESSKTLGYIFVFPFFQNGFDPNAFRTNPNGKYKGKILYDIQKELLLYGKVLDVD